MINDLNLLNIFYNVALENSVSKAANKLHISQPAVSQNIKLLEEQLGMTIDKRKIEIDKSINSLGIHNVTVDLHKDVRAEFQVHIIKK